MAKLSCSPLSLRRKERVGCRCSQARCPAARTAGYVSEQSDVWNGPTRNGDANTNNNAVSNTPQSHNEHADCKMSQRQCRFSYLLATSLD